MKAVHFLDEYIMNPNHDITVNVIGCGGTGSRILSNLAMINHARLQMGKVGLNVKAWDFDKVDQFNVGRQAFAPSDIGAYKADVIVSRINRFYGFDWKAEYQRFNQKAVEDHGQYALANINITATDTIKSRREFAKIFFDYTGRGDSPEFEPIYWIDTGNMLDNGQIILATRGERRQPISKKYQAIPYLRDPFTLYPELKKAKDNKSVPSCSMVEALTKQDLFINYLVALYTGILLNNFLNTTFTDIVGYYVNTENVRPIKLWHDKDRNMSKIIKEQYPLTPAEAFKSN